MANILEQMPRIVGQSLLLQEPWYFESARPIGREKTVQLNVKVRPEASLACPICGGQTQRQGLEPSERVWRHINWMSLKCLVHCFRPMVECEKCGLQVVSPPFESQSGTLTLFFEELAKFSLPELPLALSAELLSGDEVALAEFMAFIKIKREYSQD